MDMKTTNGQKLFIVGASRLQLPAIEKAREMGLKLAVADLNPQAPGARLADQFYCVSTHDEEGIYKAARSFGSHGVMTLATDMPMRSVAYACQGLGLPGIPYSLALTATDKGKMREVFREKEVPGPWFVLLDKADELGQHLDKLTYPLICKPVDRSGSRGVSLVREPGDLARAVDQSAKVGLSGRVILEEFMEGPEVSCEMIVVDGISHLLQITDKQTSGEPFFVETGHSQGSMLPSDQQSQIESVAKQALSALGINNCPAHVEMILTREGPKIVELGARLGGDWIASHLVPLSTGIDLVKLVIELALDRRPLDLGRQEAASAILFLTAETGRIKAIKLDPALETLPGLEEIMVWAKEGDQVKKLQSSVDRLGCVIARAGRPQEALAICREALSRISILTEDPML